MEKLDLKIIEAGSVITFAGIEVMLARDAQVLCHKEDFALSIDVLRPKKPPMLAKPGEVVMSWPGGPSARR
jgi:hypothetical protein